MPKMNGSITQQQHEVIWGLTWKRTDRRALVEKIEKIDSEIKELMSKCDHHASDGTWAMSGYLCSICGADFS